MAAPLSTQNYQELLNYCTRQVKNRDDAADLVQEAYTKTIASLQEEGGSAQDLRALLFCTLRNLIIDQHRRNQVRGLESLDDLPEHELPLVPEHQQPEEILAFLQYAKAMTAAIDGLPPRCREAFILNRFEGWPHQRVAEHMGISRNMVAQHIIRAILTCKAAHQQFHQP